ncbi:hypothetical protein YC2023_093738 [Brassica napus]
MQVLNLQGGVGSSIIHWLFLLNCSVQNPLAPFFREDINISRGGDLMGVDMFLLDSQISQVHLITIANGQDVVVQVQHNGIIYYS